MKRINEKNQHVISKMNSLLEPSSTILGPYKTEDWLHTLPYTTKTDVNFQVRYYLNGKFNHCLEKDTHLSIVHSGHYQCGSCQKVMKKIYSGFCYDCLTKKASADMCLMNPYQCHFLKGTCREPDWGLSFCYQPHYVYLSYTDKFKVGITRKNQILTRWVDQGATMGSPLCLTSSRHQAGILEKALTEILSDRSHWQKMLKFGNQRPDEEEFTNKLNFVRVWLKEVLLKKSDLVVLNPAAANISQQENVIIFDNPALVKITYPVPENIEKIKSISLEKEKEVKGKITGIKGQYIFFGEQVLNMRSHEGFMVDLNIY